MDEETNPFQKAQIDLVSYEDTVIEYVEVATTLSHPPEDWYSDTKEAA